LEATPSPTDLVDEATIAELGLEAATTKTA
jgi:hypothetical protein